MNSTLLARFAEELRGALRWHYLDEPRWFSPVLSLPFDRGRRHLVAVLEAPGPFCFVRDASPFGGATAPARLAALYPLTSPAWSAWQGREKRDASGSWRVVGHRPGMGDYEGRMSVVRSAADEYAVTLDLRYADGTKASGKGTAVIYTGYEWRGSLDLGNEKTSQVLALSEDGQELSGRWFLTDSDVLGADMYAVRDGGPPRILAVEPPFLKSGAETEGDE